MERQLLPVLNLRKRLIVLGVLLIPVLLAYRMGFVWMLLSCFLPVMLTGTYRVSQIVGESFDTRLVLGFVPLVHKKCRLPGVVYIHTTFKPTHWIWVISLVFNYLVPALGGPYEIWLETAKGREILAWNGYNQQHFESNLELLHNQTGAEIRAR